MLKRELKTLADSWDLTWIIPAGLKNIIDNKGFKSTWAKKVSMIDHKT